MNVRYSLRCLCVFVLVPGDEDVQNGKEVAKVMPSKREEEREKGGKVLRKKFSCQEIIVNPVNVIARVSGD